MRELTLSESQFAAAGYSPLAIYSIGVVTGMAVGAAMIVGSVGELIETLVFQVKQYEDLYGPLPGQNSVKQTSCCSETA